jgi:hypothetical protein
MARDMDFWDKVVVALALTGCVILGWAAVANGL